MMFFVYILVCIGFAAVALSFLFNRAPAAITLMAICLFSLVPIFQASDGIPAHADGRLAAEQWRLLAVAPLPDSVFIVTLKFGSDDIKTYRLVLPDGRERDKFLQAQQSIKQGKTLTGKARRGRAGLLDDSEMQFDFTEAPQVQKEQTP